VKVSGFTASIGEPEDNTTNPFQNKIINYSNKLLSSQIILTENPFQTEGVQADNHW
jgi:hypothetical protein